MEKLIEQQIRRWALEVQAARAAARGPRPAAGSPIITVSRQLGSGGTEVAEIVARRLGFQLVDREVIRLVVEESGVRKDLVATLDERTRSGIETWVDGVLHSRIFTSEDFVRSLGRVLITVARTGSAVVVGRGANFILAGDPGLHVRTVAGKEHRIRRLMRLHEIPLEEARERVESTDRNRTEFVERYLHRHIDDPTAYHVVLNLEEIGIDRAADVVIDLYDEVCRPA
jgi:cytidylate kinase